MRISIQSDGCEAVVKGNAEFVNAVVDAVQRYENRLVNRMQLKAKIHGKETQEQINERMAKARAAKGKKKVQATGMKRGPYKKRASHLHWSEEDDKQLADFIMDSKNYKMSATGNVFIKGFKMNALANRLKRSKKSVSQRIGGTKKFSDARDHMKLVYASSLNKHPKVQADPLELHEAVEKKKSFFNSWDSDDQGR